MSVNFKINLHERNIDNLPAREIPVFAVLFLQGGQRVWRHPAEQAFLLEVRVKQPARRIPDIITVLVLPLCWLIELTIYKLFVWSPHLREVSVG